MGVPNEGVRRVQRRVYEEGVFTEGLGDRFARVVRGVGSGRQEFHRSIVTSEGL